jgi:hypothetical protein
MAALDAGGKALQRNAGVLQRLRHLDAPHVALVNRSVLSGEITPNSIRRSMYPKSTPDRLAASAREYSATRPGYGARTAGVIAQGFSTRDVTRLEILVTDVETARSATSLKWLDKTSRDTSSVRSANAEFQPPTVCLRLSRAPR